MSFFPCLCLAVFFLFPFFFHSRSRYEALTACAQYPCLLAWTNSCATPVHIEAISNSLRDNNNTRKRDTHASHNTTADQRARTNDRKNDSRACHHWVWCVVCNGSCCVSAHVACTTKSSLTLLGGDKASLITSTAKHSELVVATFFGRFGICSMFGKSNT